MSTQHSAGPKESNRHFLTELGRAFGGAILFALPILMTMEMWWLGVGLEPWRLALLLSVNLQRLFDLRRKISGRCPVSVPVKRIEFDKGSLSFTASTLPNVVFPAPVVPVTTVRFTASYRT